MRLDLLLHRLRFAATRGLAQRWIAEGHIRRNGARVLNRDRQIEVGDVLTLPLARSVAVIEILALPTRRGPRAEAQSCYRPLDARATSAIAGAQRAGRSPDGAPSEEGN